jgi:hypothetical protein
VRSAANWDGEGKVVVEEGGGDGRWWWWKNERVELISTVMQLMLLSNSARPSKIKLDMSTCDPDNKIKSIIILEVFQEF